jgi:hypothetical protein
VNLVGLPYYLCGLLRNSCLDNVLLRLLAKQSPYPSQPVNERERPDFYSCRFYFDLYSIWQDFLESVSDSSQLDLAR